MRLALLLAGCALAGNGVLAIDPWPSYVRFKQSYAKNDVPGLRALAQDQSHASDTRERQLGILALAAADFRSDDMSSCMGLLDSLGHIVPPQDTLLVSLVHKFRGMVLKWTRDLDGALLQFDEGLRLLNAPGFTTERVDLIILKAEVYRARSAFDQALDLLSLAERLSDSIAYPRGKCLVLINYGNIKFDQDRYAEAWDDYEASLGCASSNGFDMIAQNSLNNLGSVAVMTRNWDLALHLYDSLLHQLGTRSPELRARLHSQAGFTYTNQGDDRSALVRFRLAMAIQDSIGDRQGMTKTAQHMSTSLWNTSQRPAALAMLKGALIEADRFHWLDLRSEINWKLHEWYTELDQHETANEHLVIYSELNDSLNEARFNDRIARAEVHFETERKVRRITEQDQALQLAAAEDRRKSFQRNVSIGIAALLLLIAALLYRSMRTRKRLAEKEKELHGEQVDQLLSQQEIKSINAMLEGQEKERDRMAKDLHDRLGSMLGGIKAQLGALEDRVEQVQHDAQFQKVNRLLDETVGELRQISHDMAASTLSRFGLEKALKDLRDTIHISGRLSVEMKAFGLEQRLERSVEIAVYRIIQELVSNVLKHAKASELSIDVTRSPGRLSVIVSDNGIGFDTKIPAEGMGLGNVRSRAAALGGKVQVDSSPGKGTTVSMECPVVE